MDKIDPLSMVFFYRSYLKNVFDPKLSVGPSFQLLEILEYACGL
jgi:hypothetical protein